MPLPQGDSVAPFKQSHAPAQYAQLSDVACCSRCTSALVDAMNYWTWILVVVGADEKQSRANAHIKKKEGHGPLQFGYVPPAWTCKWSNGPATITHPPVPSLPTRRSLVQITYLYAVPTSTDCCTAVLYRPLPAADGLTALQPAAADLSLTETDPKPKPDLSRAPPSCYLPALSPSLLSLLLPIPS